MKSELFTALVALVGVVGLGVALAFPAPEADPVSAAKRLEVPGGRRAVVMPVEVEGRRCVVLLSADGNALSCDRAEVAR